MCNPHLYTAPLWILSYHNVHMVSPFVIQFAPQKVVQWLCNDNTWWTSLKLIKCHTGISDLSLTGKYLINTHQLISFLLPNCVEICYIFANIGCINIIFTQKCTRDTFFYVMTFTNYQRFITALIFLSLFNPTPFILIDRQRWHECNQWYISLWWTILALHQWHMNGITFIRVKCTTTWMIQCIMGEGAADDKWPSYVWL